MESEYNILWVSQEPTGAEASMGGVSGAVGQRPSGRWGCMYSGLRVLKCMCGKAVKLLCSTVGRADSIKDILIYMSFLT